MDYKEEQDYGVLMFLRLGSVPRLHFVNNKHWSLSTISDSCDIINYLYGRYGHLEKAQFIVRSDKAQEIELEIDNLANQLRRLFYWWEQETIWQFIIAFRHTIYSENGKYRPIATKVKRKNFFKIYIFFFSCGELKNPMFQNGNLFLDPLYYHYKVFYWLKHLGKLIFFWRKIVSIFLVCRLKEGGREKIAEKFYSSLNKLIAIMEENEEK